MPDHPGTIQSTAWPSRLNRPGLDAWISACPAPPTRPVCPLPPICLSVPLPSRLCLDSCRSPDPPAPPSRIPRRAIIVADDWRMTCRWSPPTAMGCFPLALGLLGNSLLLSECRGRLNEAKLDAVARSSQYVLLTSAAREKDDVNKEGFLPSQNPAYPSMHALSRPTNILLNSSVSFLIPTFPRKW